MGIRGRPQAMVTMEKRCPHPLKLWGQNFRIAKFGKMKYTYKVLHWILQSSVGTPSGGKEKGMLQRNYRI